MNNSETTEQRLIFGNIFSASAEMATLTLEGWKASGEPKVIVCPLTFQAYVGHLMVKEGR
jgi:hypothetical protein